MALFRKKSKSKSEKAKEHKKVRVRKNYDDHVWSDLSIKTEELVEEDNTNPLLQGRPLKFQHATPKTRFFEKIGRGFSRFGEMFTITIVRRSSLLILSIGLMAGGYVEAVRYHKAYLYDLAMSVSPSNETMNFALTGSSIRFKNQYRNGSVFALPFEIENFDRLPIVASDYELLIQGKRMWVDPEMEAKLVLFGESGTGVILLDGRYTGEPFNIFLQSNGSIIGQVDGGFEEITSEDLERYHGEGLFFDKSNINDDDEEGVRYQGKANINGYDVPVYEDLVVISANPLADNVRDLDVLSYDMPYDELYNEVLLLSELESLEINLANAEKKREELIDTLYEYEIRMLDDRKLTPTQKQVIWQADSYAINATGTSNDVSNINQLLIRAGLSDLMSESSAVDMAYTSDDGISSSELDKALESEAERLNASLSAGNASTSLVGLLNDARLAIMSMNRQILLYEYRQERITELGDTAADSVSSASNYTIVTPFRRLKQ